MHQHVWYTAADMQDSRLAAGVSAIPRCSHWHGDAGQLQPQTVTEETVVDLSATSGHGMGRQVMLIPEAILVSE